MFDCLWVNKFMVVWGVEVCVFFLDKEFVDVVMCINFEVKMCKDGKIEKYIICEVFDGYLLDEVLWC